MRKKNLFNLFFKKAQECGLPEEDFNSAKEFYEYNEYGLAFDTVTTQLYEYQLYIDEEFLQVMTTIADMLKISPD